MTPEVSKIILLKAEVKRLQAEVARLEADLAHAKAAADDMIVHAMLNTTFNDKDGVATFILYKDDVLNEKKYEVVTESGIDEEGRRFLKVSVSDYKG